MKLATSAFAFATAVSLARPAASIEASLFDHPLRLQFSEYGILSYHADNGNIAPPGTAKYDPTGNNYYDWLNKFQVDASWESFTALLRIDSAVFLNAPVAAPGDTKIENLLLNRYGSRVDLEKVAVGYTSRNLDVTIGDSYVTYGRGLVLSLRKVDELSIDTTVRGANVTGRVAGLVANAVAGVSNILNVDPASGRTADDPEDVILGGRLEYHFGKWLVPGIDVSHVIYAHNFQNFLPQKASDQVTSYSATLELPYLWNHGSIFAEYAQQRNLIQDSVLPTTTALYLSGSAYFGPATLLVEYKDYRKYNPIPTSLDPTQYPELQLSDFYTAAPTLERVQQVVLNNSDISGPHGRVDVQVLPYLTLFGSMAVFSDRQFNTDIYDPYGGVDVRWQQGRSRAVLSGGYRLSQFTSISPRSGQPFATEWHGEYDVSQALTHVYSLELDGLHLSHHDLQGNVYTDWVEGQAYLSFKRASHWAVAAGYEYYTETPASTRTNYFNGSVSWDVVPGLLLRLFAGGQRAGIKCVNGVCRNFPAFDGARLEVFARY